MSETRQYHESSMIVTSGPFGGALIKAEGALCPDGVRRTAHASGDGLGDTFFSIPAFVYAKETVDDNWGSKDKPWKGKKRVSRRVYGYISFETVSGSSVVTEDDPATVRFRPYLYRKNHQLVEPPPDRYGWPTYT